MKMNTKETQAKMQSRAQALLNAMSTRDYTGAISNFDSNMTSLLPAPKLQELWAAIQEKAGLFEKQVAIRSLGTENQVVGLLCKFAKEEVEIFITFNNDSKVMGFDVGHDFAKPTDAAQPAAPA